MTAPTTADDLRRGSPREPSLVPFDAFFSFNGLRAGTLLIMYIPIKTVIGWTPRKNAQRRKNSIKLAVETLLSIRDQLEPLHLNRLLHTCLWQQTHADGRKYDQRYYSEAAVRRPKRELHHEHVCPRAELVAKLLDGEPVGEVLNQAVACVVTRDEHSRLPTGGGWDRYQDAGIIVIDRTTGLPRS